jgi:exopolysaccharide biosynthesis polyprenyl glycosylphosphotransferase
VAIGLSATWTDARNRTSHVSRRQEALSFFRTHRATRLVMAALAAVDLAAFMVWIMLFVPAAVPGWALLIPAVVLAGLGAAGHYHPRIAPSVVREFRAVVLYSGTSMILLGALRPGGVSLAPYFGLAVGLAAFLLLSRCLVYWTLRSMRARGYFAQRTLVVGAGSVALDLVSTMQDHPEYGLRPVGFVDDIGSEVLPLPVFGGVDLLRLVLFEERIDCVVVAFGVSREAKMIETIRACDDASVDVHVLPRFFELGVASDVNEADEIWGFPLIRLRRSPLRRISWLAKRAMDVMVAGAALAVTAPLCVFLALAVKLSSPGPVLFKQRRVGLNGEIMMIRKFRTMKVHSESDTEWNPGDERITPLGKVMRRLNLDEIPQLFNILKGEMSLVGPRPERPHFVERFRSEVERYDARHRVPVGLTGLAQVHGLRGDTSISDRARFDNRYIESWSLGRDLSIILRTVSTLFRDATKRTACASEPPSDTGSNVPGSDVFPLTISMSDATTVAHSKEELATG